MGLLFNRASLLLFCGLVCAPIYCAAATSSKDAVAFSGDIESGKLALEDERCQECHGVDGNVHGNNEASKIPKLAGQYPEYLAKQFADFRTGARKHAFMNMMAKTVDDATAADIVAYYAARPKLQGTGKGYTDKAQKLFTQGDPSRQIQACVTCHGVNGKGWFVNGNGNGNGKSSSLAITGIPTQLIPIIGGQDWHYLEQQLQYWRSGERNNSQGGAMNATTRLLTDEEIKLLADYIAGL